MKKIIFILSVLSIFISCDNKQKSIQSYMVNHQDEPGFMALDLPMSLIQLKAGEVPKDVKEAYESIKKINLLGLPYLNNKEDYESEKKEISQILNNSSLYRKLMKMDMNGMRVSIYYSGGTDDINEVIVYGYSKEMGVGVARVKGKNMNPTKISQMVNYLKLESNQMVIEQLKNVFDSTK